MPKVGNTELKLIKKVIDKNYVNQGNLTEILENKISNILGVKYVVMTTSGTVALFLALKSLGVGYGDEVIVPDITYIATANAVTLCGANVVLADVGEDLLLDPQIFENKITEHTKAVIPVHISGRSVSMKIILDIAKKHNIYVVEDAAEAFFSKKNGKYLGTFGNAGAFSLSPNKIITSGQGGFVVTDDHNLYIRLKQLRNQGSENKLSGGDDVHQTIGFNFKFTDLQAAVALGQLKQLNTRVKRMIRNNELYRTKLENLKGISVFNCDTKKGELPLWTDVLVEDRDGLDNYLKDRNIDCRRFWFPIHWNKNYQKLDFEFPISTKLNPKSLWLPSAFNLKDSDIEIVVKYIKEFISK